MIIRTELGVLRCDLLEQDPERDREGLNCVADSFGPGERPPERSGHRALDCYGSAYFLIGFGPVTWARPARV